MKTHRLQILSVLVVALLVGGCGLWVWRAKRQYALDRQLIAALMNNNRKQALELVNAGADPNTRYDPPPAPTLNLLFDKLLHRSSLSVNESSTAFLFVCGAEWNSVERRIRPNTFAENVSLARAMLAHGANVNVTDRNNLSAFYYAVYRNYPNIALLLIEKGVNVNEQDSSGYSPLMYAVINVDAGMTSLLLQHGANSSLENKTGATALHIAVTNGLDKPSIHQLLVHGADPNHADKGGLTPIMLAQQYYSRDIAAFLRTGGK